MIPEVIFLLIVYFGACLGKSTMHPTNCKPYIMADLSCQAHTSTIDPRPNSWCMLRNGRSFRCLQASHQPMQRRLLAYTSSAESDCINFYVFPSRLLVPHIAGNISLTTQCYHAMCHQRTQGRLQPGIAHLARRQQHVSTQPLLPLLRVDGRPKLGDCRSGGIQPSISEADSC